MAHLVGVVNTSHVPAIGRAIANDLQSQPYWKPFFDSWPPVHRWLAETRPEVAVVIYNDHGLNFFLDNMPTFAVGAASEYRNADEGWGIPQLPPFAGETDLSWHLIERLVDADFDIASCQRMVVDHAFTLPMALMFPGAARSVQARPASPGGPGGGAEPDPRSSPVWPLKVVPVAINTVQFPLPKASRCHALGEAIGDAVRGWESDARVVVVGSGGLSHQLDGERAGFINPDFDVAFIDSLVDDPRWATRFTSRDIVERAGTQGVELLMWLAARATLGDRAECRHRNYHIPISNTASGLVLLTPG